MGRAAERGEVFQAVVPAGSWYGAALADPAAYALVGGTVAPGFDFADFELGERGALLARFPQHRAVIERLTPPD
jgi:predicted cupin superfamily sugar epimerase